MRKFSRALTSLMTAIAVVGVASCGGGAAPEEDDSPEAQAYRYREGLMTMLASKLGTVRGMVEGEVDVDEAIFTEYSNDLAALAGMIPEGFIPGSNVAGSEALPEIWADWDGFLERAQNLESAAAELAQAAAGGFAAGQGAVEGVGSACGGCHRNYRE